MQISGDTIQERFLSAVKALNLEFPVAEIARKLGKTQGTVSPYLKPGNKVSSKFLQSFCEAYGIDISLIKDGVANVKAPNTSQPNEENTTLQALLDLAKSNKILADANKDLAEGNKELIRMLRANSPSMVAPQEELSSVRSVAGVALDLIAEIGSGLRFETVEEGRDYVNNRLSETPKNARSNRNYDTVDKKNRG